MWSVARERPEAVCKGEPLGDVGRSRDKTLHGSPGVRQGLTAQVVLELRLGAPAQQGPQRAVERMVLRVWEVK